MLEPERIGHEIRKVRRDVGFNEYIFFPGLGLNYEKTGFENGVDADGFQIDGQLAGLNLGDVKNAVDQGQEMFRGLLYID